MRLAVAFGIAGVLLLPLASHAADADPAKIMTGPNGKIYTDSRGMALYVFDKDEKGKSNCTGDCAAAWPPMLADSKSKASGEWTIIDRSDGSKQWAYDGKPVYTFVKDKKAGDVSGDGFKNVWHVVKAD
jgi:predicted lipoprotein with Yx(FWY)xxD motif